MQIAHTLGLVPVAEGVESQAQADALAACGCDLAQGFHLGRPVDARRVDAAELRPTGAAPDTAPVKAVVRAESIAARGDIRARGRASARGCGRGSSTRRCSRCPSSSPCSGSRSRLDLDRRDAASGCCARCSSASFLATRASTTRCGATCHDGWRLWARVAVQTFGITAVMYAIGWGPMLAIGLIFGAVESIRLSGSRAVVPAMVLQRRRRWRSVSSRSRSGSRRRWSTQPLVHGLAVLAALGVTFTIKLFERATSETEAACEAELRQSEQRFRALVQHASDIIMVIGSDAIDPLREPGVRGDPRLLPRRGGRHARASSSRTRPTSTRCAQRSPTDARAARAAAPRSGCRTATASWRWFDVIVTDLSHDPSVEGWVANLRDITERKAQEAALNEAQEAFRHAFDDAPIGIGARRPRRAHPAREPGDGACCSAARRTSSSGMRDRRPDPSRRPRRRATSIRERLDAQRDRLLPDREALRPARRLRRCGPRSACRSCATWTGKPMYQIGQLEDITDRKALGRPARATRPRTTR